MGVDLSLVPHFTESSTDRAHPVVHNDRGTRWDWLCCERIRLDRDYDLWSHFENAAKNGTPVPSASWYRDEGLCEVTTDPYGGRLVSITCRQAVEALTGPSTLSTKNAAVREYLRALNPDVRVLLWWH